MQPAKGTIIVADMLYTESVCIVLCGATAVVQPISTAQHSLAPVWQERAGINRSRQERHAKLRTAVGACRPEIIFWGTELCIRNTATYDVQTSCMTVWADVAPQQKV